MIDKKVSSVEIIKLSSSNLRGNIKIALQKGVKSFGQDDKELLKFHGIYQQKSRDKLKDLSGQVMKNPTIFMVRGRIPGGHLTKEQYLTWDSLASEYGGSSLRLTSRQSIQLHNVSITNLKDLVSRVNAVNLTTVGACGDVARNVVQEVDFTGNNDLSLLDSLSKGISDHFRFRSNSYKEIWLDRDEVDNEAEVLYGDSYLPRKLKIALALSFDSSVELYNNDIGICAALRKGVDGINEIEGYFIFVGGGVILDKSLAKSFYRRGDYLGWISKEHLMPVLEAIIAVYKDFGNRENRKAARVRHLIVNRGMNWLKDFVTSYSGVSFEERSLPLSSLFSDYLGWNEYKDNTLSLGLSILSGRIKDHSGMSLKSAIREIVSNYVDKIQVTPDQDLILKGISVEDKVSVENILKSGGISLEPKGVLYHKATACPAFPTCGLAFAEAERVLDSLLSKIQVLIDKYNLNDRAPIIRVTGCPNGCVRPYSSCIGIVGQARNEYAVFIEGELLKEKVHINELPLLLDKLFSLWDLASYECESLPEFVKRCSFYKVKLFMENNFVVDRLP